MNVAYPNTTLPPGDQGGKQYGQPEEYDFFNDFLSFKRTLGKIQILHIDLWYKDGSTGEINLTSPHVYLGEDLERQYIYMQMYLQKSAIDLGIIAYQASMAHVKDGEIRTSCSWSKVDCSTLKPFKSGQYCEHH